MAIDKGLYAVPGEEDEEEITLDELEIELEGDVSEGTLLEDGSVEIILKEEAEKDGIDKFDTNIADHLEDSFLDTLGSDLLEEVEADIVSRKEWVEVFIKGLDSLGFKYEARTLPWKDACGVFSTVLSEAVIRFQAETMSETFPAAGPVKTKILGEESKEKMEAAERVKADMNYELTERMTEYRPEHERLLFSLGLAGSAFKKVYHDPSLGRQTAMFVPSEDVIVPYGASNLDNAERVTHIMRKTENEVARLQTLGFYRDVELDEPVQFTSDIEKIKAEEDGFELTDDNRYALFEIHVTMYMEEADKDDDDTKFAKPYVITIEKGTGKVLAIRRNWNEGDSLYLKRQHFVHYTYIPGFGFYGLGLIHIIGGYARAGTSLIRQLVDAGTLSNLPGGLKTRGLRVKGDDEPIEPGEFKDVDVPSGSIKDNIMTLPYGEPSQVLVALLDKITTEGRRLGAISDMDISDMSANAPVGTTLAILERTLKPMAAVQARVHYAMKQEFKMLKAIMAEHAPEEYSYQPDRGEIGAKRADYKMVDVIPVSDPNNTTMAQRVVQYQTVLQMSKQSPQIYDEPELHRQMLEVLGVKNAEKIVPTKDDATPADPVSENMNALIGKPMKAFIYQDQEAHIATHMSFMQDPMVAQMIGQNPQAKQIMASLQAHIAEHLGFKYRKDIEERLGVTLPPPNEELPEEVEVNLARLVADAGKQLTQAHQQQAAQEQAQKQAEDPMFKLQQEEVAIKKEDTARKAKKDQADAMIAAKKLEQEGKKAKMNAGIEIQRMATTEKKDAAKLAQDSNKAARELDLSIIDKTMQMNKPQPPTKNGKE